MSGPARLEIWDKLKADSGVRLAFVDGGDNAPYAMASTKSLVGQESLTFSIPSDCTAAAFVKEARIARVWRSDSDFDEWIINTITRRRDKGGKLDIGCVPVSYQLSTCGIVPEWQVTPADKLPILDVGVVQLSLTDLFTTYLVNNPTVNAVLPWLRVGAIDSSALIDLSWTAASPRAVIEAAVSAAEIADGVPYDFTLVRNGTASYDLTVTAVS